jgi:hypothetical protein
MADLVSDSLLFKTSLEIRLNAQNGVSTVVTQRLLEHSSPHLAFIVS